MTRRRLFLDTQICIDVARGSIDQAEWRKVWHYISNNFVYFISPLTLIELLSGIGQGKEDFFQSNLSALRFLLPAQRKKHFLRMPWHFVAARVFSDRANKQDFEPENFERWVKIILRGADRPTLEFGSTPLPYRFAKSFGFSFQRIVTQVKAGNELQAQRLEDVRRRKIACPSPMGWAASVMVAMGRTPNLPDCHMLLNALDPAYHFNAALWELAMNSTYDFARHASDFTDANQLFYLCDPFMYFVTGDKRIKKRTAASSQAWRIVLYDELRSQAVSAADVGGA